MVVIFKVYDIDGDGFITKAELNKIFQSVFKLKTEIEKGVVKKVMLSDTALMWDTPDAAVADIFNKVCCYKLSSLAGGSEPGW